MSICLRQWAKKGTSQASAGSSKGKTNADTPIDLTSLSDEEEDGDYDEILLSAAPCPRCHRTIPFDNSEYENHIAVCGGESGRPSLDISEAFFHPLQSGVF